jgi:ABC-2 type transport system permease protein
VRFARSAVCILVAGLILGGTTQIKFAFDVTEDRRNSFSPGDQRALSNLTEQLVITVHLSREDPRYADLQRNVLSKLERTLPHVNVSLVGGRQNLAETAGDDGYGEVSYTYGGRIEISRSTSPREILPILYGLAGIGLPPPSAAEDYPGHPLIASGHLALVWFFGALPLLIISAWWLSRCPPSSTLPEHNGGQS